MRKFKPVSLCLLLLSVPVCAQKPVTNLGKSPEEKVPVPNPLAVLTNDLQKVIQDLAQAGTNETARARVEKLRQIETLIKERLSAHHDLAQAVNASQDTKSLPEIPSLSKVEPPYLLEVLDQLRHARNARDRALTNLQTLADAAESELEFVRKQHQAKEQDVRTLSENKEPVPDRQARLEQMKLDARLAEQQAGLGQVRLRRIRKSIENVKSEQAIVADQLKAVGRNVRFNQKQYDEVLFRIDQREAALKNQLAATKFELQQLESTSPATGFPVERLRVLRREVETLDERLLRIPERRKIWEQRYYLHGRKELQVHHAEWCDAARHQVNRLERLLRLRRLQHDEAAGAAREGLEDGQPPDALKTRLVTALDGVVAALQKDLELNRNLLEDHELLYGKTPSAAEAWARTLRIAGSIWNFEITAVDDRSVTVKKVVYAILLILIGLKLARLFSLRVVNRLLKKFKVEESSVTSISTLLFYLLAIIVTIIALGVANIPLTFFALLGGALAIGVGFGSQNIINNFISGIILLIERPIRKGDMVEVAGTHGKVDRVGLRCTQVRTFQNVDIMVPNSAFLETNVINSTLSDDRFKAELYVGVAYGSPVRRVAELILQAAKEHDKVLVNPVPEVMFMDFGDNALIFRIYVWLRMRQPSDRDRVLSELRFRIDELFHAENVVIAYPQRDVHLDTLSPLEVQIVHPLSREDAS